MKAAVLHAPNEPLTIEEVTLEKPKAHEVLLRTAFAGLDHCRLFCRGAEALAHDVIRDGDLHLSLMPSTRTAAPAGSRRLPISSESSPALPLLT
jgi:hypothetical protein